MHYIDLNNLPIIETLDNHKLSYSNKNFNLEIWSETNIKNIDAYCSLVLYLLDELHKDSYELQFFPETFIL